MKRDRAVSENFSNMLEYLRKKKGYSLQDLSDMTGICKTYIHRLEKKQRSCPSYPIVEKLAEALGVEAMDLLDVSTKHVGKSALTFEQLIMSNDFSVEGIGKITLEAKKGLLALFDAIIELDWEKETMFDDMYEAMQAIDEFKKGINN